MYLLQLSKEVENIFLFISLCRLKLFLQKLGYLQILEQIALGIFMQYPVFNKLY